MVQVREKEQVRCGGSHPSPGDGAARDRVEPSVLLYSLQHLTQWPEANSSSMLKTVFPFMKDWLLKLFSLFFV